MKSSPLTQRTLLITANPSFEEEGGVLKFSVWQDRLLGVRNYWSSHYPGRSEAQTGSGLDE